MTQLARFVLFILAFHAEIVLSAQPSGLTLVEPSLAIKSLRALSLKKDEFETPDQYDARLVAIVDAIGSKPLYKGSPPGPRFAFRLSDLTVKYDPVVESMTVSSDGILRSSVRKLGSYVGANAFNRKVIVDRYRGEAISICDYHFLNGYALPADQARRIKPKIQGLVIISLAAPIYSESEQSRGPTLDDPMDIVLKDQCIHARDIETVLYNSATGEIFARDGAK